MDNDPPPIAPKVLRKMLLQLLADRRIGDYRLGQKING